MILIKPSLLVPFTPNADKVRIAFATPRLRSEPVTKDLIVYKTPSKTVQCHLCLLLLLAAAAA